MLSSALAKTLLRSGARRQFAAFAGARETSWPQLRRPPMAVLVQQHPATPVFIGFAAPMERVIENVEEMELEEEEEVQDSTLEMSNRNNRSSKRHKANHGKRPNNRQARRAKKLRIGRRSRR